MITPEQIAELLMAVGREHSHADFIGGGGERRLKLFRALLDEHALLREVADAAEAFHGDCDHETVNRFTRALDALRRARG